MSRGFTDEERDRIERQLLSTGRELFAEYGLQKTTIGELTEPVGIANGTFYQFYDSKTDLYVEILEREGDEMLPRLIAPLQDEDDPEKAIASFLTTLMDEIETNPLIRSLVVDKEELEMLREYHSDEELAENRRESLSYFLPYVEAWYDADEVRGPTPEVVANAIRSVTFLTLHQEDIGTDHYEETRNLVISAVARGLTTT